MPRDRLQTTYVGPPAATGGYPPFDSVTHVVSDAETDVLLGSSLVDIPFGNASQPASLDTLGEFSTIGTPPIRSEFVPQSSGWYNFGGSARFSGTSAAQAGQYLFAIVSVSPVSQILVRFIEAAPSLLVYAVTTEFFCKLYIEAGTVVSFQASALGSGTKYFRGALTPASRIFIHRIL